VGQDDNGYRLTESSLWGRSGSAFKTDLQQDVSPLTERHLIDQEPRHSFALAIRGSGVALQLWEISRQRGSPSKLFFVKQQLVCLALPVILSLSFYQILQSCIPFSFKRVCDQTIRRVHVQIAPLSQQ